jgi:purine nucleoside phosphorylase
VPIDHVDFTAPFSAPLREALLASAQATGVEVADGGVYAVTQGPRLETAAEVDRLERDGADYVGMTAMPEAVLARELGMDYACVSLIVNYAAGRGENPIHEDLEAGTMTAKIQTMKLLREFFGATDDE